LPGNLGLTAEVWCKEDGRGRKEDCRSTRRCGLDGSTERTKIRCEGVGNFLDPPLGNGQPTHVPRSPSTRPIADVPGFSKGAMDVRCMPAKRPCARCLLRSLLPDSPQGVARSDRNEPSRTGPTVGEPSGQGFRVRSFPTADQRIDQTLYGRNQGPRRAVWSILRCRTAGRSLSKGCANGAVGWTHSSP